ncbi:MAG: hypothetical protein JJU22_11325 [Gammaproteobacteria bacterium]|nr:hypothetical protein [Gammaproteobacteria bacterium]
MSKAETVAGSIYAGGWIATLVYLMFFDGFQYNWWNWVIVIPINFFLASIWPVYWLILHWIF